MQGAIQIEGELDARDLQVAIVAARFNDFVIVEPVEGRLRRAGLGTAATPRR